MALDDLGERLLAGPDFDIAGDVEQFKIDLIVQRLGRFNALDGRGDGTLENKVCSEILAGRFDRVRAHILSLFGAFLTHFLALAGISDILYLPGVAQLALQVFEKCVCIQPFMAPIQHRADRHHRGAPGKLREAL